MKKLQFFDFEPVVKDCILYGSSGNNKNSTTSVY